MIPRMLWTGALASLLACAAPAHTRAGPPGRVVSFAARRDQAQRALSALERDAGKLTVHWPAHRTRPAMVRNLAVPTSGGSDEQRARGFLSRYPGLFVQSTDELVLEGTRGTADLRVIRFSQVHQGIEVLGGEITVALDRENRVTAVHSEVEPVSVPSLRPAITALRAAQEALQATSGTRPGIQEEALLRGLRPTLVIVPGSPARLAYRVVLPLPLNPRGLIQLVDARSGQHLGSRPGMKIDPLLPRPARGQEVRP